MTNRRRSGQNDASSRQDQSSLSIGLLDTSTSLLTLLLPLITGVLLVRNDIGDAIDQILSKLVGDIQISGIRIYPELKRLTSDKKFLSQILISIIDRSIDII